MRGVTFDAIKWELSLLVKHTSWEIHISLAWITF